MAESNCDVAGESLAELALGTLRGDELITVSAHVEHCNDCRREVTAMLPVASQLLELIPGTEPPLGFDRRVLSRVEQAERGPGRFARRRTVITAVAAAVAVIVGVSTWLAVPGGASHRQNRAQVAADFVQRGRDVGKIEAHGTPLWLTVTVRGTGISGPVTCEVVHDDGSVTTMGSFDLVGGSGTWSTPDPGGMAHVARAELVDPAGDVVAVASFS